MSLALEVGGVLGGIWAIRALLRGRLEDPEAFAVALVAVPALLGTVIAVSTLWPTLKQLVSDARMDGRLSAGYAAIAGSTTTGARADFLAWAASEIPPDATYYLVASPLVGLWATYQLMPRRAVAAPAQAQWIVLYGTPLSALGAAAQFFGPEQRYTPGLSVARKR